jgi:hypothetical protein
MAAVACVRGKAPRRSGSYEGVAAALLEPVVHAVANLHIPPRGCFISPPPDGIFRNYVAERLRCRRKIEMTSAARNRDDTPAGGGGDQRDTASHPPNHWVDQSRL